MTPDEARARARAILNGQIGTQVVHLDPDGSVREAKEPPFAGKKTVLHDPLGEYV